MDLLSEFALVNNKCDLCDSRYVFGGLWLKGLNNDLRTSSGDMGLVMSGRNEARGQEEETWKNPLRRKITGSLEREPGCI